MATSDLDRRRIWRPVAATFLVAFASGCAFDLAAIGRLLVPPQASPSPTAKPSSSVSAADLTGQWIFGAIEEPPAGPVLGCYPFKLWNLAQTGSALHGSVLACVGPCSAFTEETDGQNSSGSITLSGLARDYPAASGSAVSYALQFNPSTQHLAGVRNDQPFWAAPFIQKPASLCGPAPL